MAENGRIPQNVARFIVNVYEKTIWEVLGKKAKLRISIQGSKLVGSRHIEGTWTLIKKNVMVKVGYRRPFLVDKLKIIAIPKFNSNGKEDTKFVEDVKKEEPFDFMDVNYF
uniref:Uncharacterized protein n=1 Tax=Panagrolaimus sp. JU765 TaxID=591449 RepID=A0AC34RHP5_9BILA